MNKFVAAIVIFLPLVCLANDRILILPEISPLMVNDGSGVYDKVLRQIVKRSGESVEFVYYPPARSVSVFGENTKACFPASKQTAYDYLKLEFIDAGVAFNKFKIVFATLKNSPLALSIDQLKGQSIAAILGENIGVYGLSESEYNFYFTRTHDQSLLMLEAGRVSALLGSLAELKNFDSKLRFNDQNPLYLADESIVCHVGKDSETFLRNIRAAIESMKRDGTLRLMLGDFYLLD